MRGRDAGLSPSRVIKVRHAQTGHPGRTGRPARGRPREADFGLLPPRRDGTWPFWNALSGLFACSLSTRILGSLGGHFGATIPLYKN